MFLTSVCSSLAALLSSFIFHLTIPGMTFRLVVLICFFPVLLFTQTTYTPDWNSLDQRATPAWWQDAKFGIFIHWGVYSVPAYMSKGNSAEWYQYSLETRADNGKTLDYQRQKFGNRSYYDLADDFKAELYDPTAWAQLFQQAGAKYVILTAKHHDGFCLWPSAEASRSWGFPWTAADRGPKRDLVEPLFQALRRTDLQPGLYFSLYEWYHPLWRSNPTRFAKDVAMPQLHDLVNRYRPAVVWADGDWEARAETWQSPQFLAWLYNESPVRDSVVVNDRWGTGVRFQHGGVYTPEYQPDLDFEEHAWEENRGMGASYGYNRAEDAWDYNSAQSLILHLVDKVSRGGNFLLDIGPDASGKIPPIMQERLLSIGKWLKINGEAIYGTRRWRISSQWSAGRRDWQPSPAAGDMPVDPLLKQTVDPEPGYAVKEVFYTYQPAQNTVYAIFPRWPVNRQVMLKNVKIPVGTTVTLLPTGQKLRYTATASQTVVYLPAYDPAQFQAKEAYVIKIAGYGNYVATPHIAVNYAPNNMVPTVSISCGTPDAVIRYTTNGAAVTSVSPIFTAPFSPATAGRIKAKAFKTKLLDSNETTDTVQKYILMPATSFVQLPPMGLNTAYTLDSMGQMGKKSPLEVVSTINLERVCKTQACTQVWQGYLGVPVTQGYQFWTDSDDGSTLYIDHQTIVNNAGNHGVQERSGLVYLQKGWHSFQLNYDNAGGPGTLQVQFAPLGGARKDILANMLAH